MTTMFPMEPVSSRFESQAEAAEHFEVDPRRYRAWEANGVTWDLADRIAGALGLHPSSVWGELWWDAALADEVPLNDGVQQKLDLPGEKKKANGHWFEQRARETKVVALVAAAQELGLDAARLVAMEDRGPVVAKAGVRKPSDTTWALVIERLTTPAAVTA